MKLMILMGVALIVFGIVGLVYNGVTYTSREKVLDIGPIEAIATTDKTIPVSPILGVVALVGGVALVIIGGKQKHA